MRKTFVTTLVLLLFFLDCLLFAFVNGPSVSAEKQATSSGAVVRISLSASSTPALKAQFVRPQPSPTVPPVSSRTPAGHPASNGSSVQGIIPATLPGSVFFHGSSAFHEVALTFDDGPNPFYTPQVLAILQQYNVKATFFCIGRQVQYYASLVRRVENAGELIADHTWDHFDLTKLSPTAIQWQLSSTAALIERITGMRSVLFRPPYGALNDRVRVVATRLGLLAVMWSIDTNDWQLPGTTSIINSVLNNVNNGSIILMHDGGGNRSETVRALPTIITLLRQQGFRFVTVQQLLMDKASS